MESRQGRNSKLMNFGRSMDIPASPLALVDTETSKLFQKFLHYYSLKKSFLNVIYGKCHF